MAIEKTKKTETIVSLGTDNKLLVQKSLPLFSLWKSDLTLAEFKILDTYLSRIDSHKPDKRTVFFEKGELEKLLGVTKINQPELEKRLIHLMGNVVKLPDTENRNGFKLVTLFEEAEAEQDDYGIWQVKMKCTQNAMKYFFNIENLGYLRYKLRCITSITSRYTYILFIYLEANRFRKSWTVSLQELKEILNCEAERYKQFKFFNSEILKKAHKEMHEKTECRFKYEPIKKGRSVVAIKFTLETNRDFDQALNDNSIPGQVAFTMPGDDIDFLRSVSVSDKGIPEWSRKQTEEIYSILTTISETKLPEVDGTDDLQIRRYHLLKQLFSRMNRASEVKPIRNRYNYFLKMLKQINPEKN